MDAVSEGIINAVRTLEAPFLPILNRGETVIVSLIQDTLGFRCVTRAVASGNLLRAVCVFDVSPRCVRDFCGRHRHWGRFGAALLHRRRRRGRPRCACDGVAPLIASPAAARVARRVDDLRVARMCSTTP